MWPHIATWYAKGQETENILRVSIESKKYAMGIDSNHRRAFPLLFRVFETFANVCITRRKKSGSQFTGRREQN